MKYVAKKFLTLIITLFIVSLLAFLAFQVIPGVGRLLLASISNRDFPVVQAIVVILAAWIVVVNFVADLLYQLVDPRIRLR